MINKRIIAGVCLAVLLSFSNGYAQTGAFTLDAVDTISTGIIDTGAVIQFGIRMDNNTGSNVTGSTNGFVVKSPDGATWSTTVGTLTGAITAGMMEQFFINPFDIDGAVEDTLGFGGFSLFAPGVPAGFGEVVWTIDIGPIPASDVGKQICLDSAFYPPGGTWKWSTVAGPAFPTWDGPHCFSIVEAGGGNPNQPPVLNAIGPQAVSEDTLLVIVSSASDAESIPTMDASPLPTGATFNDNGDGTGTFNWKPGFDASGDHIVTFSATDDSGVTVTEDVTISVANLNRDPVLAAVGNKSTIETQALNFVVQGSDVDNDPLTMSMTSPDLPPAATFTPAGNQGAFVWTPQIGDAGTYSATFYATDSFGAADSETVTITVDPFVAANNSPVLDSIGPKSTDENVALSFGVSASDADGTIPQLTMVGATLPAGPLFVDNSDGTGSFTWVPSYMEAGSYPVTFYAIDTAFSPNDTAFETITITVVDVNRAPLLGTLSDQSIDEGLNLNFDVTASDPDGTVPSIWAMGTPAGASFTDNSDGSATFDWTTTFADSGTYPLTVYATDGIDTVSGPLTVTVVHVNQDPVLDPIGDKSTSEGGTLTFGVTSSDFDGDALALSMTSPDLPLAAVFTDNGDGTGSFNWPTTPADAGTYSATFAADDSFSGHDEETITITVSNVNSVPVLSGVGNYSMTECEVLDVVFSASDSDGDPLSLWVDPLVQNMTFTDNGDGTGSFHFAPSFSQEGNYNATAYASDGIDTAMTAFMVTVIDCQPGSDGDTISVAISNAVPGARVVVPISFTNTDCAVQEIHGLFGWLSNMMMIDSVSFVGSRVEGIASKSATIDNVAKTLMIDVVVSGEPDIQTGSGLLANVYLSLDAGIPEGLHELSTFLVQTPGFNPTFIRDCGSGPEEVATFVVVGGVMVQTVPDFVCGTVVDKGWNPIPGATVQLWADYPNTGPDLMTTSNSFGSFAFDGFTVVPYDLYAYADGYYPGKVENLNFGQTGVMIVLTPLEDIYPTNEWVNFYCGMSTIGGAPLPLGSVVEAKDPSGVLCGRMIVDSTAGFYKFMSVYRDDAFEPGDQGADPGDLIRVFVNGIEAVVHGNHTWTSHGDIMEVCLEVSETVPHSCQLVEGWNLVSWPVDTDIDDIETVLASIANCIELVMGFEQGGLTYDPLLPQFSTLHQTDHLSGYWIKIKTGCSATLTIAGRAVPITTPIPLTTGWNLVSYLSDQTMLVQDALASIHNNLIVAQGYDGAALTYEPGQPQFNTLTDMSSCFGYWVKVTQPMNLIYPDGAPVPTDRVFAGTMAAGANADVARSTRWMNLYSADLTVNDKPVKKGAEITAHNQDGLVIGRYTIGNDGLFGFMAVYADDPNTDAVEGVAASEQFYLSVDGEKTNELFSWTQTGDRVEIAGLTAKFEDDAALPSKYSLKQNYPNPFNPSTTIDFSLKNAGQAKIQVYNVLGELVATPFDAVAGAGQHKIIWDGRDHSGNAVSSGVYFYRLTADNFTETRKMMLLK